MTYPNYKEYRKKKFSHINRERTSIKIHCCENPLLYKSKEMLLSLLNCENDRPCFLSLLCNSVCPCLDKMLK